MIKRRFNPPRSGERSYPKDRSGLCDPAIVLFVRRLLRDGRPKGNSEQIAAAVTTYGRREEGNDSLASAAAGIDIVAFTSRTFHGYRPYGWPDGFRNRVLTHHRQICSHTFYEFYEIPESSILTTSGQILERISISSPIPAEIAEAFPVLYLQG